MDVRVEANGLGFHVIDEGSGPPVVFLHGFPDTSRMWAPQIAAVTEAGFRAIAPDLRGRGRTDRPEAVDDYRLTSIVADVTGVLHALEVERAHVVGHDWGAAVAWLVAAFAPARVDHLVAISVGFPGAARPDLEALQKGWYRLLTLFDEAEELFRADDWYLMRELLKGAPGIEEHLDVLAEPGALTAGLNWYRANLGVETLGRRGSALPHVQAPTLGVYGRRDPYLTERMMVASEAHVDGPWRYAALDDVGHWVPVDAPDRLNELLLDFLPGASPRED